MILRLHAVNLRLFSVFLRNILYGIFIFFILRAYLLATIGVPLRVGQRVYHWLRTAGLDYDLLYLLRQNFYKKNYMVLVKYFVL